MRKASNLSTSGLLGWRPLNRISGSFKLFEKGETLISNWPRLKMVGVDVTRIDTRNFINLKSVVHIWKYMKEVVEGLWRERKVKGHQERPWRDVSCIGG